MLRPNRSILLLTLGFVCILFSSSAVFADEQFDKMLKLCNEGNSTACFNAGETYRTLDRDNKKALALYVKSCEGGYMTACNNAGILTQMQGQQYSKYWKEAAKLFGKGCDADESNACSNLASLKYKEGRTSKAKKYYKRACDLKNMVACGNLKALER